jgi:hypothetical protein
MILIKELTLRGLLLSLLLRENKEGVYYYEVKSKPLNMLNRFSFFKRIQSRYFKPFQFNQTVSEYNGAFYQIEELSIIITKEYFDYHNLSNRLTTRIYRRYYSTDKFSSIIKSGIEYSVKRYLKFLFLLSKNDKHFDKIIFDKSALSRFIAEQDPFSFLRNRRVYWTRQLLPNFIKNTLIMVQYTLNVIRFMIGLKYTTSVNRYNHFKIGVLQHIISEEGLLRSDFLIDNISITSHDCLFLLRGSKDSNTLRAKEFFHGKGYNYAVLDELKVPIIHVPGLIFDYFVLPFYCFFFSFFEGKASPYPILLGNFSLMVLKSRFELLFYNYNLKLVLFFHSGDQELMAAPIIAKRYKAKTAIYNFGTTISRSRYSTYAFQNHDIYFAWGEAVTSLYKGYHSFDTVENLGFWGKKEYQRFFEHREELKSKLAGLNSSHRIVTFYDIPYFSERSSFTARSLLDFHRAALRCSYLEGIAVIIKMKSFFNVKEANFPLEIRKAFDQQWKEIINRDNIYLLEKEEWDPLQVIAISDVNVTLDISSPSTIALICGRLGLFYNTVEDYVHHPLYPKYRDILIFNDIEKLLNRISQYIFNGVKANNLIDDKDLECFDTYRDDKGLERFRRVVLSYSN